MHYWVTIGYKQDLAGLSIRIHSKIITWKDKFMSIIALLHNLLKEKLPSIHATRLHALMAAVEAGLSGACIDYGARAGAFRTRLYQTQNQTYGSLSRELPSQYRMHGVIWRHDPVAATVPCPCH
jgi:hypothetical protein